MYNEIHGIMSVLVCNILLWLDWLWNTYVQNVTVKAVFWTQLINVHFTLLHCIFHSFGILLP